MGKFITVGILSLALLVYWEMFSYPPFDPDAIRGQRVLITGSSTGIGEQLAYQYAKLGARLIITARSENLLKKVAKQCEKLGAQQVHFVVADMADQEDRSRVFESVEEHLEGLDHLILNHAIIEHGWWVGSVANLTLQEHMLQVNFLSYTHLASKALPMLVASRGRIGVVSSFLGEVATIKSSLYSANKFALHGFFSSLRQEMRHKNTGVSVTITVLGPVQTDRAMTVTMESAPHLASKSIATSFDAARAILESVFQRRYRYAFDWKYRALLLMNRHFPELFEDSLAFVIMNYDGNWLARIALFVIRNFYAN